MILNDIKINVECGEDSSSLGLADFCLFLGFVFEAPTDRLRFPPKPWFSPPIILGERPAKDHSKGRLLCTASRSM